MLSSLWSKHSHDGGPTERRQTLVRDIQVAGLFRRVPQGEAGQMKHESFRLSAMDVAGMKFGKVDDIVHDWRTD